MTIDFDPAAFLKDRREMLLALDVGKMREYAAKYGSQAPRDDEVCLASMHLARLDKTLEIPRAEREYSRAWLTHNGYETGQR